ncbi:endoribonuclease YbeY [endosymbiont of Euscepes postfasciatus]|uniref:rRNA maturation RNase YbeY n=1 Tax=endosymbiont of Euscepes postfasciatus TaxID=650377 RepID=UPI000DC6FDED|nr:rRNA maturation RNase YbeY [endosymbiont of Euscepes postfasciatus]BBA84600.1 endoribonuclease YbeY [endosymbiont of Euscepes postfasciatus]
MSVKLNIIFNKVRKNNYFPTKIDIFNIINYLIINNNNTYNICLYITNNKEITKLNNIYKNINRSTNILTFNSKIYYFKKKILFCDIIMSKDKIEEESKIYNIKLYLYWIHIITHGFLHILGYTHKNNIDNYIMKNKELFILKKFKLKK